VTANLKNAPEVIDEVLVLLADLKGAWNAIETKPAGAQDAPAQQARALPLDNLSPRSSAYVSA
jgi:flagellin-specific chaperone FliS